MQVPTLGWLYLTDHFGRAAEALLADASRRWPGVAWVGAVGVGIAGTGVEYFNDPAVSLMLSDVPVESFRVFSGVRPLGGGAPRFEAATAQVHADPATNDLGEIIGELATRVRTGYLFGGLASARGEGEPGPMRGRSFAEPTLEGEPGSADFGPMARTWPASVATAPQKPARAATVASWLLALLPLAALPIVASVFAQPLASLVPALSSVLGPLASAVDAGIAYLPAAIAPYAVLIVVGLLLLLSLLIAAFDAAALKRFGQPKRPTAVLGLLSPLPYLAARAIVLRRSGGAAIAPAVVALVLTLVVVAVPVAAVLL